MDKALKFAIVYVFPYLTGAVLQEFESLYLFWGTVLAVDRLLNRSAGPQTINIYLSIISFCLTLTFADLLCRPVLVEMLNFKDSAIAPRVYTPYPFLVRFRENKTLRIETHGDLAKMSAKREYRERRKISFVTDSLGFRNDPNALKGGIDMILLGDSFAAGAGTSQEKMWSSLFTQKYKLNAYSLGIMGTPWDELMDLKITLKSLKVRENTVLLWALFAGNDFAGLQGGLEPWPNSLWERLKVSYMIFRNESSTRLLYGNLKDTWAGGTESAVVARNFPDGQETLFFSHYIAAESMDLGALKADAVNSQGLRTIFEEMGRYARSNKLTVAVVLVPTKESVYSWVLNAGEPWSSGKTPSGFSQFIEELSREADFPFLDLKPYFVEESRRLYRESGKLLWWRDDTHWNDEGHALAARLVYENLLRHLISR